MAPSKSEYRQAFGKTEIIRGVSVEVPVAPSSCWSAPPRGKSTLLRMIAELEDIDSGVNTSAARPSAMSTQEPDIAMVFRTTRSIRT